MSRYCVAHKKLFLTYHTYAASQFFTRALSSFSHQSCRFSGFRLVVITFYTLLAGFAGVANWESQALAYG